jgi:ABC-type transporter Mla subunit MlaD
VTNEAEQLQALLGELKTTIKEGHQFLKDARAVRKEIQEYIDSLQVSADVRFAEIVEGHVEGLARSVKTATDVATANVFARFDKLANLLLGEDPKDSRPSLEELARIRNTLGGRNSNEPRR